ncbi:hypothetical protein Zmor_020856 [Zophobas morio]|uniref:Uncharacterized protein n=1 Tax=Zophobas morio TaxID=2755281 RepID=A0AA38I8B2_9CUCU|nr:hypothetical protein Zmor_020856 [Zophobas morio]
MLTKNGLIILIHNVLSGDGESSITEGLRTALARLRQRSTPPGSQTSPLHQPSKCVAPESCSSGSTNNSHCPSSPRPKMTVNSQSGPRSPRPPDDLISTATSALRRLHFKTGRNATKNSTKQMECLHLCGQIWQLTMPLIHCCGIDIVRKSDIITRILQTH